MGMLTSIATRAVTWATVRSERKDAVAAPISAAIPAAYSAFFNPAEITPWIAWQLYKNVSPLAKVVDLIADEVARLEPLVIIDNKPVPDHPIAVYMRRPGFRRTRQRFIKELCVQYLVTGTAYPVIYGNVQMPQVLAMDICKSQYITPVMAQDMWTQEYWYTEGTRSAKFQRDPSNPRDFRWIEANGFSEIVPIYDMDGERRGVGLSRLNAVRYDVELRLKGIQHNAAILDNGARPSGHLSFKEQLNDEQIADLKQQVKTQLSGASGAGGLLITGSSEAEFTALSQTMKDMDFAKLIQIVEDSIVSRYNVPVTLFRTEAQTNNNYNVAWTMFYNTAVKPTFDVLWSALAQVFSDRMQAEVEIQPDELKNPILANQAIDKARKLYDGHLLSRNEAREIAGYEDVLGGDTIYGSISDTPQAEDYFTSHGINDPGAEDNSREAYHQQRPEANPINQAGAEAEAAAAGAARGAPPETAKPKPKKKAVDNDDILDKAIAKVLSFAEYVDRQANGDTEPRSRRRKVA